MKMRQFWLGIGLLGIAGMWGWKFMVGKVYSQGQNKIYVDSAVLSGGDGSREAPFIFIEDGIDKAKQLGQENTRILVAGGTYVPKSNLMYLDSHVPRGLSIEGGYNPQTWQRVNNDISVYPSIIKPPNSGDSIPQVYW